MSGPCRGAVRQERLNRRPQKALPQNSGYDDPLGVHEYVQCELKPFMHEKMCIAAGGAILSLSVILMLHRASRCCSLAFEERC